MEDDGKALGLAVVIALLSEVDGLEAATKAAQEPDALIEAARRFIDKETAAAVAASNRAKVQGLDAEAVQDAAGDAAVHTENVRAISALDPSNFRGYLAVAERADAEANEAAMRP